MDLGAKVIALLLFCAPILSADDYRGLQFIGFTRFDQFTPRTNAGTVSLTSPQIEPAINWDELIPSWNYRGDSTDGLTIEAQIHYPDHHTKWFILGHWSRDPTSAFPRASVRNQADADADVLTDTLRAKRPGGAVQIRVTLSRSGSLSALKFLGLTFSNPESRAGELPPDNTSWGKTLSVPELSQANYPEGITAWCSPTAVAMLLNYWAQQLNRLDLEYDVPAVARAVNDPQWPGTGNWPFNMAFAGAHPGMRAYVARLSDVRELEQWIAIGIPVALSVSYNLLQGKTEPGNGHLVLCIGFTEKGDLIANDPGRKQVRQVYTRENLIKAWTKSRNTVYLVYPENHAIPPDPYHHWVTDVLP